ncbi:MAG: UDP-N-acetylmuramate dehydrogenase, partial [Elusimicrobia bacterium]|nr:UDP-N-acetylmuramate dehydrogenase [Elusimicrobiota bacterium]
EALGYFAGVGRRIELKGEADGVTVVDDYGHHPTEIAATIAGVRGRWPGKRLVVLFQPHRYSRTKLVGPRFGAALKKADKVVLMPIYAAGEKPIKGVTSAVVAKGIPKNKLAHWGWDDGFDALRAELKSGDVLLTLGAGDVVKAGETIIKEANSLAHRLAKEVPSLAGRIKSEEPLSRHCTWAIGGPAEAFVEIKTLVELRAVQAWCRQNNVPVFILGWGSNVLLPDEGLRGVVVRLRGDFEKIDIEGNRVTVGAGVHLPKLAKHCVDKGLAGVEALAGVPGTVGGALMTNAGTPRGVIGDVLVSADVLEENGSLTTVPRAEMEIAYRHTSLIGKRIVSAVLELKPADADAKSRLAWELESRAKTQPLGTKNVGSVFRNPPNDHAARLIEAAGLKGRVHGKLRISPKHANFIENTGGGTAKEALELMRLAQTAVKEKFNVDLVPEVMVVGAAVPQGVPA